MIKTVGRFVVGLLAIGLWLLPAVASAQQGSTAPSPRDPYGAFLKTAAGLLPAIKPQCRTQQCISLEEQTEKLVSDAQDDDANGVLVGAQARDFHENFQNLINQLEQSIKSSMTPAERQFLKKCRSCNAPSKTSQLTPELSAKVTTATYHPGRNSARFVLIQQSNPAQCAECGQVFEAAVVVCAAWAAVPGVGAAIAAACELAAVAAYENCIAEYCGPPPGGN